MSLDAEQLLSRTKGLAAEERRVTVLLISHLEEIQNRRLFAEIGFSSMWEFCTKYLHLSEGSAQRRIQAMRLVQDLPPEKKETTKSAMETGQLSLVNAATIQSFLISEKKNRISVGASKTDAPPLPIVDAGELVDSAFGLSQRDLQAKLYKISPQSRPKENTRIVSEEKDHQLKFVVSNDVFQKLQKIKGLIAHKIPNASLAELTDYLASQILTQLQSKNGTNPGPDRLSSSSQSLKFSPSPGQSSERLQRPEPIQKQESAKRSKSIQKFEVRAEQGAEQGSENQGPHSPHLTEENSQSARITSITASVAVTDGSTSGSKFGSNLGTELGTDLEKILARKLSCPPRGKRTYLSVHLRRKVFKKAEGRCEYSHKGRRCTSIHALEIDHEVPLALNGSNDFSNLRVLCKTHNLQQAYSKIGGRF